MTSVELATWVGALGAWVSGLAVAFSVYFLWRQIKGIRSSIESNSYHQVENLMIDIDRYFIENFELWQYFRNGVAVGPDDPNRGKLILVAEMLVDHFDNVYHQRETLPNGTYDGFVAYMRDTYDSSPILQQFLKDNKLWYNPEFISFLCKPQHGVMAEPSHTLEPEIGLISNGKSSLPAQ